MKIYKIILLVFLAMLLNTAIASPKEIIIIRHGDKLTQADPGPALSPKGMIRSIAFANYFLNTYGAPDYIVAVDPRKHHGDSSIRELQTIAPLANMLAANNPKTGFPILHPYKSSDYAKLANYLLSNNQFNGKVILVCWDHTKIPQLAGKLGVAETISRWPADDFDTVYIIKYKDDGSVQEFNELANQYPVNFDGSWQDLYNKLEK